MIKHLTRIAAACFVSLVGIPDHAKASPITLNLDCVLNFNPCQPTAIYGTITLEQMGAGVLVTVDLVGTDSKFRDLMLNYAGSATVITASDSNNTVSLTSNGFGINPYDGLFDVGGGGGKGWNGQDLYSTLLTGNTPLLVGDFLTRDGIVYAALHIQGSGSSLRATCEGGFGPACDPAFTGPGSKIGASNAELQLTSVPEPASLVLMGTGLLGAVVARRRKARSSHPAVANANPPCTANMG